MSATKRIMKEWKDMQQNPVPHWTASPIEDDVFKWNAILTGPPSTPYKDGKFHVSIIFPSDYPFKPPKIQFQTPIYHCNVNKNGQFCLGNDYLMKEKWSPAMTIGRILREIVEMIENPNPDDPLVPEIAHMYKRNRARHDELARAHTTQHATPIAGSALASDNNFSTRHAATHMLKLATSASPSSLSQKKDALTISSISSQQ